MIQEFIDKCNSCGKCEKSCLFLTKYGKPDEILKRDDEAVFECTNCRACTLLCPFGLDPAGALFEKKAELLRSGKVSEKVLAVKKAVNAFAMRGHRFPFVFYGRGEYVFWPGCGLSSVSPQVVRETQKRLSVALNADVALVFDCCFDPCYQMGDVDTVNWAIGEIEKSLTQSGVKTVITGCANCTKVLSNHLKGFEIRHVLEILPASDFDISRFEGCSRFHNPCPSFMFKDMQQRAKAIVGDIPSNKLPSCCGFGGELHHFNAVLSLSFADRALGKDNEGEDKTVVTYCMGCKQRFQHKGAKAYHILEGLKGVQPVEAPPSTFKKYLNRFLLATQAKINPKKLSVLALLISLIAITAHLRSQGYISVEGIMAFIKGQPILAPLLFIALYAIGPSLFIPSLPMTLGAGFIWGPLWGSVFAITGATMGATMPFLLARYIMADTIKRRFSHERWENLNEKVKKHGWKAVAFARLMPILPFPVLNYLFGITPIPIFHYVWATFVFMLPACIAYTAFGSSMGELILKGNIKGLVIGIVIASVAMAIPFLMRHYLKKSNAE
jgi:uncharacterized membrane protein YdjX (TVP38/TMEM64 family)/Fe-S oxidoreductase